MPVKMTTRQLAFWRELLAPFADHELSEVPARGSKKVLTYLDKRALSNRLDSVCGPDGWDIEYVATARGYKARLGILCPTRSETDVWHYKEDGAGFEEMGGTNKTTGEFEYDVDNDEKSGYTNAFRRAAQDAWGIGRYLYKKGIPTFLDPNAAAPVSATPAPVAPAAPLENPGTRCERPTTLEQQPADSPAQVATNGPPKFDNFKIPKPGKSVFAWAKEMEKVFETTVTGGMANDAEALGWGKTFTAWNEEQVNTICMKAINFFRTMPTYRGQFDHLFGGVPATPAVKAGGVAPGINVADIRKSLVTKMNALVFKQTGSEPTTESLRKAFQTIAASSANCDGHKGEIPESLSKLTDLVWLNNMIATVDQSIAVAVANADDGDAEIPF